MRENTTTHKVVVIGTGPSAMGACLALVSRGFRPFVLDIGLTEQTANRNTMGSSSKAAKKSRDGSLHMYEWPQLLSTKIQLEGDVPVSSAFGGLSTVWGTNIQGCIAEQHFAKYWPMAEDYLAVLENVPHSGKKDDLESVFNWPVEFTDSSQQSARMDKLISDSKKLHNNRVVIGAARNATRGRNSGCMGSGRCLIGCPYQATFSTEAYFLNLVKSGKITYQAGREVVEIHKYGDGFRIASMDSDRTLIDYYAQYVFVAAGTLSSLGLAMSSGHLKGEGYTVSDTQVAYVPFFSLRSSGPNTHALAQVFIESSAPLTSDEGFHISLYESNDEYRQRVKHLHPLLSRFVPSFLYRRLIAGIAFLPANKSGYFSLNKVSVNSSSYKFSQIPPSSLSELKKYIWKHLRFLNLAGLIPINFLTAFPNVGASYHVGSLKTKGGQLALNELGEFEGFEGLHYVDGLALPVLPAGPITLTTMANAYRIARESRLV